MSMSCRLRSGKSLSVTSMPKDSSSMGAAERGPQTVAASEAIQTVHGFERGQCPSILRWQNGQY